MFFDLKPGRLAWVVTDKNGAITASVPGSLELLAPYPGLQTFIDEWSHDWSPWAPESPSLAREMPGDDKRSGLLLEAVPIVSAGTRDLHAQSPRCVLICVSLPQVGLPQQRSTRVAVFREKFNLTVAECRVAAEVAEGSTPTQIALRLVLSVHTVRSHLKRIYVKVGVHSQAALVRALLQAHDGNSRADR